MSSEPSIDPSSKPRASAFPCIQLRGYSFLLPGNKSQVLNNRTHALIEEASVYLINVIESI
jgi:hypothetical protein